MSGGRDQDHGHPRAAGGGVEDSPFGAKKFVIMSSSRDAVRLSERFILKTAVNAKTPRGKGAARDREMRRKKRVHTTHPAGDCTQPPKPLRLCTFAPSRWFNCFF
jgi:hypothetical protein